MPKIRRKGGMGPLPKFNFRDGSEYHWSGRVISGAVSGDDTQVPIPYFSGKKGEQYHIPFTVVGGPGDLKSKLNAVQLKLWNKLKIGEVDAAVIEDQPLLTGFPVRDGDLIPVEQYIGGVACIIQGYQTEAIKDYWNIVYGPDIEEPITDCTPEDQPACSEFIPGVTEPANPGFYMRPDYDSVHLERSGDGDEDDKNNFKAAEDNFLALKVIAWTKKNKKSEDGDEDEPENIEIEELCWCNLVSEIGSRAIPTGNLKIVGTTGKLQGLLRAKVVETYTSLPGAVTFEYKPEDSELIEIIMEFFITVDSELDT